MYDIKLQLHTSFFFFFNDTATTEIYTLSLHDALPILLFTPGFSTALEVSEIAGRGVGLDVVKRNLQALKGSIDITSAVGEGTTFRIMLPISLAIIQALIVRAGNDQFAVPLTSVEESL